MEALMYSTHTPFSMVLRYWDSNFSGTVAVAVAWPPSDPFPIPLMSTSSNALRRVMEPPLLDRVLLLLEASVRERLARSSPLVVSKVSF